jgi:hypothetical protein
MIFAMSNAEVIALIDAVLALPVSDLTKNDLRSFRLQVQAGTIAEDDRNYVIKLSQRLWQGKGEPSVLSGVDDNRAREEAVNTSVIDEVCAKLEAAVRSKDADLDAVLPQLVSEYGLEVVAYAEATSLAKMRQQEEELRRRNRQERIETWRLRLVTAGYRIRTALLRIFWGSARTRTVIE